MRIVSMSQYLWTWLYKFWFLCLCGLLGLLPTSGDNFMSIAPSEIYLLRKMLTRSILIFPVVCCCQGDEFSQELHVYFSRTMPGLILHELQQRGFIGIECVCLTCLPAVQICLLLKMYGASWRGESDNGYHKKLSSSSHVHTKNGQKFHLQNCNNWYIQFPNDYKV